VELTVLYNYFVKIIAQTEEYVVKKLNVNVFLDIQGIFVNFMCLVLKIVLIPIEVCALRMENVNVMISTKEMLAKTRKKRLEYHISV